MLNASLYARGDQNFEVHRVLLCAVFLVAEFEAPSPFFLGGSVAEVCVLLPYWRGENVTERQEPHGPRASLYSAVNIHRELADLQVGMQIID